MTSQSAHHLETHGLTPSEFGKICNLLRREPNLVELGVLGVMWSEHCSYKSSRLFLSQFPTKGVRVLQGPGENAGAVDIGDGWACVFKIESHNHPSYIEPYQGAATGVGGILRDIFTMGARPLALLDFLCFGAPDDGKTRLLLEGVVSGIAGYGNSIGVPVVGGGLNFHDSYQGNPLVNVLCAGLARTDKIFRGRADGVGNKVLYVGSKTGRDGIHGATMASEEFAEGTEHKKPTVQVGDPFTEKRLLEACMEAMEAGLVIGIQDMGAAGLTSSSVEMAARSHNGIELYLDQVPQREMGMSSYEILLSESQERMLLVAQPGEEERLAAIFKKWDLDVAEIGRVTSSQRFEVCHQGTKVVDLPVGILTDEAPRYRRSYKEPAMWSELQEWEPIGTPQPQDLRATFLSLLGSPNLCSRRWVFEQYDHMVRTNTLVKPGEGAGVIRIKGTEKSLALTVDGNGRLSFLDPYVGGKLLIAEAARNLICAGARPLGLSDCLNFGNPEKEEIMWQFVKSVEGIAEACRVLEIPVVSGNVSFYNDTQGCSIAPTPVVAMVGLVEAATPLSCAVRKEGDILVLLGEAVREEHFVGSEYLFFVHHIEKGKLPDVDLLFEKRLHEVVLQAFQEGILSSAHDCSEGGLVMCIAEKLLAGQASIGAKISINAGRLRPDALLFGEAPSRIVVSLGEKNLHRLEEIASRFEISTQVMGVVGGESFKWEGLFDISVTELKEVWEKSIPKLYGKR